MRLVGAGIALAKAVVSDCRNPPSLGASAIALVAGGCSRAYPAVQKGAASAFMSLGVARASLSFQQRRGRLAAFCVETLALSIALDSRDVVAPGRRKRQRWEDMRQAAVTSTRSFFTMAILAFVAALVVASAVCQIAIVARHAAVSNARMVF